VCKDFEKIKSNEESINKHKIDMNILLTLFVKTS